MDLEAFVEDLEPDEEVLRRRLAAEKSYEITDYLEDFERRFDSVVSGETLVGSTAPEIFVGRSRYPSVPVGVLSPVGAEDEADEFATSGRWYRRGLGIEDVLQRRTGLLNSNRRADVRSVGRRASRTGVSTGDASTRSAGVGAGPRVHDVWEGFLGVQREVAIADRPVDVEIDLADRPDLGVDPGSGVATPRGPRAPARDATLTENPHVPRAVEKTLSDDDWRADGAMTYLYRRGFDVYDINTILSAGALGRADQRRLVPTRWSITAVDDTVGQYLRGRIRNAPSVDAVEVYANEYVGNRYWIVLAPGRWEYELVEMKAPGSVWNPNPGDDVWMASAAEGAEGRTGYVEETAGAYYAARLGVLEHLESRGRQAKCLVLREVSDEYWAPVGVWQIRESVRDAFDGEPGEAETFHGAVATIARHLPVSHERLRRKSELVAGLQADLSAFGSG